MSNFSISSPKLVFSIGHTTMQEAGANGTQKLAKADISTSIFQKMMAELVGTYIVIFIGCGAAHLSTKYLLQSWE
ncbi:unnamed protein product [Malus baccata var. baccata]